MIQENFLRPWQKEAYNNWVKNGDEGIVLSSTGSGKSLAAMYCIQEKKVNTLIVVPTIALMNQWKEELTKNLDKTEIGQFGDGVIDKRPISVAVINSIRERDLSYFEMIILDEIHKYGSIENIKPIMNNKFKYKLGLTATLKRADGQHEILEELIGKVIYEYNTEDAVNDGILSKFEIVNVGVNLVELEKEKYNKYTKIIDNNHIKDIFRVINERNNPNWFKAIQIVRTISWRKAIISNAKEKMNALLRIVEKEKDNKIIIFNETIKMAEEERKLLKKNGYISEIYHSKSKNQEAIEKFKRGDVKILISVKSLNEGLDVKDVDVGIRVAGTNQDRDTIQRLGRSLRVTEGKVKAKYYQLYCDDTIEKWQIIKNTNVIKSASDKVTWIEPKDL